jgi:CBS domain containing-hemolysin-like protein
MILTPLMRAFYLATKPVVDLFNGMGNLLLKPFGVPPASEAGSQPHSEDELRTLLRESSEKGLIQVEEQRVTEAALLYGDRRAREVMKPRPEVVHLTTDQDLAEAGRLVVETGHTRFPLCGPDGGLDSAIGVVNAKDLLQAYVEGRDTALRDVSRPVMQVSEAALIDELLRDMRRRRTHIAVVVDEHGTATGLVTIEDVLEEIVGEIEDEFDADHDPLVRREDGVWMVDGQADLRTLAEELGLVIDDHHEATISGHLLEKLGRIPEVGETLEIEGRQVEITRVGEARIDQLRVPVESLAPEHPSG